jgi:hypothetical protein
MISDCTYSVFLDRLKQEKNERGGFVNYSTPSGTGSITTTTSSRSNVPFPSKPQLYSVSASPSPCSVVLHGFAYASCTEPGNTTNPAASQCCRTAAMKIVLFIVK